jgi:hypothetical protein
MPISKIKKIDYENSVKNRYIKQGQKMMDCCELVLEETCLMEFYQNSPSCNDTYLNVYINGVNANVKSLDCFRLNKWNNWTSNDIMCIEPTYAYQHIYKKRTHLASFTSIVFYKDYIYNEDSYNFFIDYATTDKLPKLVNKFYYDKKECAEETNITITEEEQIICDEENCISYIYLIREREFINKNEQVYKVGRTTQERGLIIKRFKAYKKGSEIIFLKSVENTQVNTIENVVKKIFNEKFKKHNDGTEYFIGSPDEMCKIIFNECVV